MGIRFLQSYLSKNVRDGIFSIDIKTEIDKYRRENEGEVPTVVVDLLSLHRIFYDSNHELILGGRYNIYNDRAEKFLREFKDLGVNLVFFTDGPVQAEKLTTCLTRRNDNYAKAMKALEIVYSGADLTDGLLSNFEVQSPVPFFSNLTQIARKFGEVRISVLNECDIELAEYASRTKALAVISNDTDFLIFEGDWRLWSSAIDLHLLRTDEFNKHALRTTLNLKRNEMPIFATMAGNDIIPYDMIKKYHFQIKRGAYSHFQALASQVRSLHIRMNTRTTQDMEKIARKIFNNSSPENIELVKSSLDSYDYSTLKNQYGSEILSLAAKDDGRMNYIILANIKYILQLHHFDLSKSDFKPFFRIIEPILRRVAGILLYHRKHDNNKRIFYSKLRHLTDYEPINVEPDYPTIDVPPLKELLYEPEGINEILDKVRMQLACWAIGSELDLNVLRNLSATNAVDILTIFHLVKLVQITIDEADCLMISSVPKLQNLQSSLDLNEMRHIDDRDCRIAFLFTSTRIQIKNIFYATGLTAYSTAIQFDGLYFHSLRKKWNSLDQNSKDVILNGYNRERIYL